MFTRVGSCRVLLEVGRGLDRELHRLYLSRSYEARRGRNPSELTEILSTNPIPLSNARRLICHLVLACSPTLRLNLRLRGLITLTLNCPSKQRSTRL